MHDQGRLSLNEDQSRRRRVAIVASLIINLLFGLLLTHAFPDIFKKLKPPPKEVLVVRQTLRIEKPKRVVTSKAPAPPSVIPIRRPVPVLASVPAPAPPRKIELSKPKPHFRLRLPPAPVVVAHPAQPATKGKPVLSEERIAQIEGHLASAIEQDRSGINPLHVPGGTGPDVKHYGPNFADLGTSAMRHHGLCDPVQSWKDDGWNYYYVICNVRFSDGSSERQGVPWPVRFNPSDDPFAGTAHDERPLAMPLPGWHLGPNQTISVELREYAHEHGVDI
jgi:hypothetical protein